MKWLNEQEVLMRRWRESKGVSVTRVCVFSYYSFCLKKSK